MTRGVIARSDDAEPDMEVVAEEVRTTIRRVAPRLKTVTKWGYPWQMGNDLVVLVGAFSHHAAAEFWRGSALRDPKKLLEGTGKNLRHVKFRTMSEARSKEFADLVRDAMRLDARMEKRTR